MVGWGGAVNARVMFKGMELHRLFIAPENAERLESSRFRPALTRLFLKSRCFGAVHTYLTVLALEFSICVLAAER